MSYFKIKFDVQNIKNKNELNNLIYFIPNYAIIT